MKKKVLMPKELYTIIISLMFLGGFLLLVIFGARSYRAINRNSDETENRRAVLIYLSTTLKADECSDIIISDDGVLRIRDSEGEYEKVIYIYEGKLMEEYTVYDGAIHPASAVTIADCERLETEYDEERHLLKIETEKGPVYINTGMRELIYD
ncbi:MAG: DUF4860 domain-containing protein [Erysipelotrichaceae bacterium]|nr:DUF4860 domain-containing protein [Erysipelotrichaceae bacterium]